MSYSISDLAKALADYEEHEYVRFAADWIAFGGDDAEPALTGKPVVDALVAAAAAHRARLAGRPCPAWARDPRRRLASFWHPGPGGLFAWSLAHAPAEFLARGIIVEANSLVCV